MQQNQGKKIFGNTKLIVMGIEQSVAINSSFI